MKAPLLRPAVPLAVPPAVLALLALLPVPGLAGPPEGVSGAMALDEVAGGLRKHARGTDPERRAGRLAALAPSQDPRVAVALGEALPGPWPAVRAAAFRGAAAYHGAGASTAEVCACWQKNEADLRRRAEELP
jgi:hypothetical protein